MVSKSRASFTRIWPVLVTMVKASASAPVSVWVSRLFSGSTAATGAPMLAPVRVFSSTVRWPSSESGKTGRRFSLGTGPSVIPSALLPDPRLSSYSTRARR